MENKNISRSCLMDITKKAIRNINIIAVSIIAILKIIFEERFEEGN